MTKENKELLLKDLCGRLPYGVKFRYKYIDEFFHEEYGTSTLDGVIPPYRIIHSTLVGEDYLKIEDDEVRPYLFPLSSMSEEQKVEYDKMCELDIEYTITQIKNNSTIWTTGLNRFNWLLKNHFDVYGLIPMDLAFDATDKNIY